MATIREDLDMELINAGKEPLLPEEQTKELICRVQNGETGAEEELLRCHMRFVISTAKRFLGKGVSKEELIKIGTEGMKQAIMKFDTLGEYKFVVYAVWHIRNYIQQAISNKQF